MQSFRFPFSEAPLEILEEINYLEEITMFVKELLRDRDKKRAELLELYKNSPDIQADVALILEGIVGKEFMRLHKCAPNATHLRVTFHLDVKGVLTYNTRLSGEYKYGDPVVTNLTCKDKQRLMSLAVVLSDYKSDLMSDCIPAMEEYDTDAEEMVYTFEFFC